VNIWPDSAFGRAALAIALVLVGSQLLLLLPLRALMFGPVSRQMALLYADNIALIQAQTTAAPQPERGSGLRKLVESRGWHLASSAVGPAAADPPVLYYQRVIAAALHERLGPDTECRVQWHPELLMWVRLGDTDDWIGLPLQALDTGARHILLIWAAMALLLSLAVGFILARSLTSNLRRLAAFAARIGCGGPALDIDPRRGPREVRALAEAMNRMAGDLRRHAEDKALLLAGISHDLRTPLARMRLSAELLAERDAETRDSLIEDIDEMDASIGAFIASVREEMNEPSERLDTNELVHQAAARLSRWSLRPVLDLEPLRPVQARPGALARVLDNLLENARRHGAPPIELSTRDRGAAGLRISVLDRGPGLDPNQIATLFKPFARGAGAAPGGMGLGLVTARRLVREQGGEFSLHPRAGGGLEARIDLPAATLSRETPWIPVCLRPDQP